ncbi:hypothetical protein JZ751_016731 [Albula glossodonta]|uniref:Uncharacterized protein n=1 Tax=Albula glossodonta TaxID=121402 RepID=A0A8T2NPS0_9TELE|nr:hypothetical protein JZ751_016731 [Albula glossodonta]
MSGHAACLFLLLLPFMKNCHHGIVHARGSAGQSTTTALEPKATKMTTMMSVTTVTVTTEEEPRAGTTPVATGNTILSPPKATIPNPIPTTSPMSTKQALTLSPVSYNLSPTPSKLNPTMSPTSSKLTITIPPTSSNVALKMLPTSSNAALKIAPTSSNVALKISPTSSNVALKMWLGFQSAAQGEEIAMAPIEVYRIQDNDRYIPVEQNDK